MVDFKKYQTTIENFLDKEKKSLDESYNKSLAELDQDDYKKYNQIAKDYYYRSGDIATLFPHNFRASFLVQIITFIEHELKLICEHYEFEKQTKYSINDLKGTNDIEKAKQFLEKSCNVNFRNLDKEWQFILKIKRIRNKLIHSQGFVKKTEKDWKVFNDFNNKLKYFDFSPKGELVEEPKLIIKNRLLIDDLLKVTEDFFNKLLGKELKYNC
ncbi:hypothetical protein [Tenacibaculum dicentrarchi]|uniref:hypothetical protein n=1 Tax=Tenacibaculum dicentrarchi TaxID=669041 RepID=UPI003514B1B3